MELLMNFSSLDTDGDGFLSLAEIVYYEPSITREHVIAMGGNLQKGISRGMLEAVSEPQEPGGCVRGKSTTVHYLRISPWRLACALPVRIGLVLGSRASISMNGASSPSPLDSINACKACLGTESNRSFPGLDSQRLPDAIATPAAAATRLEIVLVARASKARMSR